MYRGLLFFYGIGVCTSKYVDTVSECIYNEHADTVSVKRKR